MTAIELYEAEAKRIKEIEALKEARKKVVSAIIKTHQKGECFDLEIDLEVINNRIKELGSD